MNNVTNEFPSWDEISKWEKEADDNRIKEMYRVLRICQRRVSECWYDQLVEFIDFDCGEHLYDFKITDKPCCSHKQKERNRFAHIFVHQSCGIAGDDWAGEVSIPIRHGKYLTYSFEC